MSTRGLIACVAATVLAPSAAAAANPVQTENARAATPGWAQVLETTTIEGYGDRTSVEPGETIGFHVAASAPGLRYRILVFRVGWYGGGNARLAACLPARRPATPIMRRRTRGPRRHTIRAPASSAPTGPSPISSAFPPDWVSGYYEARVQVTAGPESGRAYRIWFVVREPRLRSSTVLVQVPVNTWQAYNAWGGRSIYDFNSSGGARANRVSFDRPYAVGIPGSQASPLGWEYQLVRFLEREGVDVSYQTDVDTDRDPGSLLRHRLVAVAGHDEYWTKVVRDAFEGGRDQGTNLAFMGANAAYWQVRYENDRRTLVGYKSQADPVGDPAQKTVLFRDLGRPECQLVGVQFESAFGRGDYHAARDGHGGVATAVRAVRVTRR